MANITLDDLVLCTDSDLMSGWVPGMQRQVQVVQLARAKNATQYDRRNLHVTYSFTVARSHANYGAAMAYEDDLPRACGRAFGTFTANRGFGSPVVTLERAHVTFSPPVRKGIRTWVQFLVTGELPAEIE